MTCSNSSFNGKISKKETKILSNVYLCFKDNPFYFALPKSKNYFEPRLLGELAPYRDFREIYRVVETIKKVISEQDLNTRIWTKD